MSATLVTTEVMSIRVPANLAYALSRYAAVEGITRNALVVDILTNWMRDPVEIPHEVKQALIAWVEREREAARKG